MRGWWWSVVAVAAWVQLPHLWADVQVLKDATLGFGEALQYCREKSQLTEAMMEEFFHFWGEDFKFEHRELGCAMQCMSQHFNLLTDSQSMNHEKTHEFISSFPNGEVIAAELVSAIHACEQQFAYEEDHCWRILRVAECFKESVTQRGFAPNMEMLIAEFIMDSED